MTTERYEHITGSLTQKLREHNAKIIRDRRDIEDIFREANEEKKNEDIIQAKNKLQEEEEGKIKLLEDEARKKLLESEEKRKLLEEENDKLLEEAKARAIEEAKANDERVKEKLMRALKERKEEMCKLEEENDSLWAGSREVASLAEETVVVETQAERSML